MLSVLLCIGFSVPQLREQFVEALNAIETKTWTAGLSPYFAEMTDAEFASRLMPLSFSLSTPAKQAVPPSWRQLLENEPRSYDFREAYPDCHYDVLEQGACSSSWAFSALSMLADRRCAADSTALSQRLSEQYLLSCDSYANGCRGSFLRDAWRFLTEAGVPEHDCLPYKWVTLMHGRETRCPRRCLDGSRIVLTAARGFTDISGDPQLMIQRLLAEGPLQTTLVVYGDLRYYSSGVYNHVFGDPMGVQAVEIIGYGVNAATGVPYWTCRNSWGSHWGEAGHFRILRGSNECNIEGSEVIEASV